MTPSAELLLRRMMALGAALDAGYRQYYGELAGQLPGNHRVTRNTILDALEREYVALHQQIAALTEPGTPEKRGEWQ